MILNETFTLADGVKIPKLGLGTWFIDDGKAAKYGVSAARLCIRYAIQMGAVTLPTWRTPPPWTFVISDEDMEMLKHMERITDYGEFGVFPVFSGKPLA